MNTNIGFIGAGNMATALIKGILANGYSAEQIIACDPSAEQLQTLQNGLGEYRISTNTDNQAASNCDILVLAVKPQILPKVAKDLSKYITEDALVVSVAAGITLDLLAEYLENRGFPNIRPEDLM